VTTASSPPGASTQWHAANRTPGPAGAAPGRAPGGRQPGVAQAVTTARAACPASRLEPASRSAGPPWRAVAAGLRAHAATQILLRQAPQAIGLVGEAFRLSAGAREFLLSAAQGADAQPDDPPLRPHRRPGRAGMRPGRPVSHPRRTVLAVTACPPVRGRVRDLEPFRRPPQRPAILCDAPGQAQLRPATTRPARPAREPAPEPAAKLATSIWRSRGWISRGRALAKLRPAPITRCD